MFEQPLEIGNFSALCKHIDPEWIRHALAITGKASMRRRKLPAEQLVWLVIALALFRKTSIAEVVVQLDLVLPDTINPGIANSAITQARQRMGQEPLAQLFGVCSSAWDCRHQIGRSWRGLSRYAIDGSTLRTADTAENREYFGAQRYASGVVASYPQLRLLTLTSLSTHLIKDAVFGEYDKNEMRYAKEIIASIPDHSVTALDKGFLSAQVLLQISQNGVQRHWIIAAKSNTKWDKLDTHKSDYRVQMKVSPQARKANPQLPEHWQARAIEVVCTKTGSRRILLTSLMDSKAYGAKEIARQYEERWHIETSYRELKQQMLGDKLTLRSGQPQTVCQEVWGALLAYNLVRLEMAEIAKQEGVAATDMSFTAALLYLRFEWQWLSTASAGAIPKKLEQMRTRLAELLLPKNRRGRQCPRVVKQTPSRYPIRKVVLK